MFIRTTLPFVLTLVAAGCGGSSPGTPANVRGCWGNGCAMVTTSHYNPDFTGVGTLNAVQMKQDKIVRGLDASLDPDTQLDIADGKLYVLNRTTGALRRYDLATLTVEEEIPTGSAEAPNTTSSPFGFVRGDGGAIYVSLAGNDSAHAVGVLDEAQPNAGVVRYIAVPAADDDSDGKPEVGALYACDGLLYAAVQDYTYAGTTVTYSAGRLAVIDPAQGMTVGFIDLAGKNPGAIAAAGSDCKDVLVATSSDLTSEPDGTSGVERVDLGARASQGFVTDDTAFGGRPYGVALASPTLAFVPMYSDPQTSATGEVVLSAAKVVAWNPKTGALMGDVTGKAGFINFARVSPDGLLFVGAGDFDDTPHPDRWSKGLYWGKADGTMLSSTPIDLGDTPSAIAFQK